MHWSKLFIPTLRDDQELLLRAGYVRWLPGGIYAHLFLAQRSLLKITKIVREEMDSIGAQEFLPSTDATHLETMTSIARGLLRSYKQLPQIWFTLKDSCSFDRDAAGLDASYEKHREAYCRILDRSGLKYLMVEAHSGHEFMVLSDAGEEVVVRGADYAANLEKAVSVAKTPAAPDPQGDLPPEEFHTPGVKTIAEVAQFAGQPITSQIKSLVMVADGNPILALLRGDHQLSKAKLADVLNAADVRAADPEELRQWFGADAGSLGPVGVKTVRIVADNTLRGRRNMIAGANRNDYHLRNVTPGEDFEAEFHDLRRVAQGDTSVLDGSRLTLRKAIQIGHMLKRGDKYEKSKDLRVTNESGQEIAPFVGSYGISIERILSAAVELYHDADGIVLPGTIAPFTVVVTPVNIEDDAQRQAAEEIYTACKAAGLDALFDDRDERPGVKFKDADLIGIPYRITVGKKLPQGIVELVERKPKRSTDVPIAEVVDAMRELWTGL
jgi:prolyl-tRNA synthetase